MSAVIVFCFLMYISLVLCLIFHVVLNKEVLNWKSIMYCVLQVQFFPHTVI